MALYTTLWLSFFQNIYIVNYIHRIITKLKNIALINLQYDTEISWKKRARAKIFKYFLQAWHQIKSKRKKLSWAFRSWFCSEREGGWTRKWTETDRFGFWIQTLGEKSQRLKFKCLKISEKKQKQSKLQINPPVIVSAIYTKLRSCRKIINWNSCQNTLWQRDTKMRNMIWSMWRGQLFTFTWLLYISQWCLSLPPALSSDQNEFKVI